VSTNHLNRELKFASNDLSAISAFQRERAGFVNAQSRDPHGTVLLGAEAVALQLLFI
jgi:hypothetical protein